ncbi:MAG TPA: putative glycoside hydrolase, partial [Gammaproteobacteria bacterium]|nr:putative glycoside hydrolase [Gammaproteobacteria bacterium]
MRQMDMLKKVILNLVIMIVSLLVAQSSYATSLIKGIYLTQYTLEDTAYLNYLIEHSKAVGINTFIIDLEKPGRRYQENIALVKKNNIRYVARIIMFPGGGTKEQVTNPNYWQAKYALVKQAIDWGADEIQMDYIRYNTEQKPTPQNAQDINQIIGWYKSRLNEYHIPLQLDVFGIASFGPSPYIGQDIKVFSSNADAMCPMVYPSHFEPFKEHAVKPYETVYDALAALKEQFPEGKIPFKLYPYIELSNYRYKLTHEQRLQYIVAQIRAAEDVGADGWYVWSPHNEYDPLFAVL